MSGAERPRTEGWIAIRRAFQANTIPGFDRYAAASGKLTFAQAVWKMVWMEQQAKSAALRAKLQAEFTKSHGAFASIEYAPPNNEVYRAALKENAKENATRSPVITMLAFTFVGVFVGILGSGMRLGIEFIEAKRFDLLFEKCDEERDPYNNVTSQTWCTSTMHSRLNDGIALLIYLGVSCALILVSGGLVAYVAPAAAASGLPEVIAFLNGTFQGKIFAGWTLIVKFTGCLLAVGSGLPAGPEAPMIHLGAMVGRSISDLDGVWAALSSQLPFIDHFCAFFRNEKDARDLVTAGTAAGVASAFGAPVGGVLFALEEIASSWTPSLTWKVFWTSMLAASMSSILISMHSSLEEGDGYVGQIARSSIEFYQPESSTNSLFAAIPATVIGAIAGALAAGFTGANLRVIALRKKYIAHTPWRRIAEPIVYMIIVAVATVYLSTVYPCTSVSEADPAVTSNLVGLHCPKGEYNELATLLYNPGGEVIKILWSRHYDPAAAIGPTDLPGSAGRHTIGPIPLLILACLYIPMACLLASSIVPTGLIVPVLLIGGTVGRLLGLFAQFILPHANDSADADCDGIPWYVKVFTPHAAQGCVVAWNWVDPGAFAIYGSAAFFGGISRLHLTIPVIFMEITGQVRMLLPIMLACKVGSLVADYLHPHSLFHAIIELKGLTFLAAEAPADRLDELDRQMVAQIVSPGCATISSHGCTIGSAIDVLDTPGQGLQNDITYAVIDREKRFEGTISLIQLLSQIEATLQGTALEFRPLEIAEMRQASKTKQMCEADATAVKDHCRRMGALNTLLPLGPVINTSTYTVRDNMSILRAYTLFRSMGCRQMVVVDIGNHVVGMLTRNDLVEVCHPPHEIHEEAHPPTKPGVEPLLAPGAQTVQ